MTVIDDASAKATSFLKAAESTVQAFRALTPAHRSLLQANFPTLSTNLSLLAIDYGELTAYSIISTPPASSKPTP